MTATTGPLLVGIDAGLTSTKAVAFASDGGAVASASRDTPGRSPCPDREEQPHDDLWRAVADAVSDVVAADAVDPERIAGAGVAGHGHGLYALDADGDPAFPGIKSTDGRAVELCEAWREDGTLAAARERLGWEPFGADPFSLLAWLRREAPDRYERVHRLLFCKDVLTHRLTGRAATDTMEASVFGTSDDAAGAFELLGIANCADAVPEAVPSTARVGTVTDEAAAVTGIPAGTPVAAGLHDVGACALGAGAVRPGQGVLVVGTWGQSVAIGESPTPPGSPGISRRYLDGWLTYRGTRSAAACVDWFVGECAPDWRTEAADAGVDEYALYDDRVAAVTPGAGGVLFQPFLRGSTDDPTARAGFYGLRADHGKAHMLRAIYEGVAVDVCSALARLEPADGYTDVRLTGGGARSEVWSRIFADVRAGPVTVPGVGQAGALGAALCGGVAAGVYADAAAAVDAAVTTDRTHTPEQPDRYKRVREAFDLASERLPPVWTALADGPG